jgi:hypothetical protein
MDEYVVRGILIARRPMIAQVIKQDYQKLLGEEG